MLGKRISAAAVAELDNVGRLLSKSVLTACARAALKAGEAFALPGDAVAQALVRALRQAVGVSGIVRPSSPEQTHAKRAIGPSPLPKARAEVILRANAIPRAAIRASGRCIAIKDKSIREAFKD